MAAPTAQDGLARAVEFFLVPCITTLLLIVFATHFFGEVVAGLILVALTMAAGITLYIKATYWNILYTTAFLLGAIYLFFATPSITEHLVPPIFQVVNSLVLFGLILFLAWLLASKIGITNDFGGR